MTVTTARQQRIAASAAQYRFTTFLLAVLLFPFQLIGWAAAVVWVAATFAWAAVAVSFGEGRDRMRGESSA